MLDRYTLPAMKQLWGRPESKFEFWLKVEMAYLQARMELEDLPREAYDAFVNAKLIINVPRIEELEAEFDHDMIAFIVHIQEQMEAAGYGNWKGEFHKKITSYNIEDPALILMLQDAATLILEELNNLKKAILDLAIQHQWTLMIARTHGQSAEPSTFGQLLLVFADAITRSRNRLIQVENSDLTEGNMSGAVGTFAGLDIRCVNRALEILDLLPSRYETQILQRDRHAMLLSVLAITAGTIEQIARTFWEMMRSDVHELEEPRRPKQRGSSAMAHKKNPILTERLMGMARLLRAYAHAAMENIATPEWRDISQSSVERHIFPDATSLCHYMIVKLTSLVKRLVVFPERMRENLDNTYGVWAGQQVRAALMDKSIDYDTAYLLIQQVSFEAVEKRIQMIELLSNTPISEGDSRTAKDVIGETKLQVMFDPIEYVRAGIEHIFSREEE